MGPQHGHDGAIFAEVAPPITGSDSVVASPATCLPAGVLVSFTVEEAGRVLLAQGDALSEGECRVRV